MKESGLFIHIRNYRSQDFQNYLQFHVDVESLDRSGRQVTSRALTEYLDQPVFIPSQDLFIAEKNGKIIGTISVTMEKEIGRAILDCLVHPKFRRRHIANSLIVHAMDYARKVGIKVVQMSVSETDVAAGKLMTHMGFTCIRCFLEMRLIFNNTCISNVKPSALTCRYLQKGEEDLLKEIQNLTFRGTWGFNPNTRDDILHRLNLCGCAAKDVLVLFKDNRAVAYCWTRIDASDNKGGSIKRAKIHMLGVDPHFRNRGVGKMMLLHGLMHLRKRGVETIELTVDSENAPAKALYKSLGFEIYSKTFWWERELFCN